jgi:3-deoxy-D-manno-octulosonate 8-phosphate phosphatase (KDO 8-P phosphatase)
MIETLIMDVDGVLTDGKMIYGCDGKMYKSFGVHDRDGLELISEYIKDIKFITADKSGFSITFARIIKDWGYDSSQLILVSANNRMQWFEDNTDFDRTAFIADGHFDAPILKRVKIGIAPNNATQYAKSSADIVTKSNSGSGAVYEACLEIIKIIEEL